MAGESLGEKTTVVASRHVAIWIDAEQAILELLEPDPAGRPDEPRSRTVRSRHVINARSNPVPVQTYETMLSFLEPQGEIWILGPGQAKDELRRRIEQSDGQHGRVSGICEAPTLAQVQLVLPTVAAKAGLEVSLRTT